MTRKMNHTNQEFKCPVRTVFYNTAGIWHKIYYCLGADVVIIAVFILNI